ncbi:MAG: AraC family transcriptional regulator [Eubacteriales bacterium]|nr:AraC family transcriptional regulator [Eubacteriales bacterium]
MRFSEKQRKWLAGTAAFLIAALVGFSCLFIVTHAEHDCVGEGCDVCAELEACEAAIRSVGGAVAVAAVSVVLWKLTEAFCLFYRIEYFIDSVSLVSLKIRLDD